MIRQLTFAALMLAATSAHAGPPVVIAVGDNYPPLMGENGGIVGRILSEANNRMAAGHQFDVIAVPWSRAVALVENGQAQGLAGTYHRPQIRPWLAEYSTPLTEDPVSIFCRQGVAKSDWQYPQDFAGLRFGFLLGSYSAGPEFVAMRDAGKIDVEEARTMTANVKKLMAGRVDCFVEGTLAVQAELASLGGSEDIEIVQDISIENMLVGYLDSWTEIDGAAEFINAFDAAIDEMHLDGTVERMVAEGIR